MTVCDWHTYGGVMEARTCDMVSVKVDVHELLTTVGDGPVKPYDQKIAHTNCKEKSI